MRKLKFLPLSIPGCQELPPGGELQNTGGTGLQRMAAYHSGKHSQCKLL